MPVSFVMYPKAFLYDRHGSCSDSHEQTIPVGTGDTNVLSPLIADSRSLLFRFHIRSESE